MKAESIALAFREAHCHGIDVGATLILYGHLRGHGLTIRPIRTMLDHATTDLFFDDLEVRWRV